MKRAFGVIALASAAAAVLAACGSAPTPPPSRPVAVARPVYTPPAPAPAPAPPRDQCGADDLQWLVGKPRTEIPVPVDLSNRRVACTTCPVTEEYMPRRLNIFFDADSGLVREVRCG